MCVADFSADSMCFYRQSLAFMLQQRCSYEEIHLCSLRVCRLIVNKQQPDKAKNRWSGVVEGGLNFVGRFYWITYNGILAQSYSVTKVIHWFYITGYLRIFCKRCDGAR